MSAVVAGSERRGRGAFARTRRLLVIDDDAWCRAIANGALGAQGHRVISMGASDAVVGIARGMMPDLVLADVMLPHLELAPLRDYRRTDATHAERFPRVANGYAVLRALEADSVMVHRVVVLLKDGPEGASGEALRFGVVDYVLKPFTPRALVEKVESVLALLPKGPESVRSPRTWDEPAIDGRIEYVGVTAILEMLHLNQLSGVVTFKGAGNLTAEVFFRDGEIDAAVMSGGVEGAAAVYRLLTWTSGRFWLVPKEPSHKKSLGLRFEQILLEGLRRLDESRRGPLSQSMRGLAEPSPFFPSRES
jgi:CheY-like chemotaxis protein